MIGSDVTLRGAICCGFRGGLERAVRKGDILLSAKEVEEGQ